MEVCFIKHLFDNEKYSILFPEVLNIDEFVRIELYSDWFSHSNYCKDCGELFKDIGKSNLHKWIIYIDGEYFQLENNYMSSDSVKNGDQLSSILKRTLTYNCEKTFIKLKKGKKIDKKNIEEYEYNEEYEICDFIKKNL